MRHDPDIYMPMLQTADNVAKHYKVSRQAQDEYSLQSQQRVAAAQAAGRFDAEIVPLPAWKYNEDKDTGAVVEELVTLTKDEGNRPDTTLEGLSALKGVLDKDSSITAGNSSQLSDGAAAVVIMGRRRSAQPRQSRRWDSTRSGRRRLRSRRNGHRAGVRDSQAARTAQSDHRRYRALGAQRGLRRADHLLAATPSVFPTSASTSTAGAISIGHPYGVSGARIGDATR